MITQPIRYGAQSATLIDNVITKHTWVSTFQKYFLMTFCDHFQISLVTGTGDISFKCHSEHFMKKVRHVSENNFNCFEEKVEMHPGIHWMKTMLIKHTMSLIITFNICIMKLCLLLIKPLNIIIIATNHGYLLVSCIQFMKKVGLISKF